MEQDKKQENSGNDIKKLLNAHMLVLKDKLGRAPTADEIAEALKGDQNTSSGQPIGNAIPEITDDTTEPKILKLKVYYGQGVKKTDKGDLKVPDPNKILFYEGHDGKVFDCSSQNWTDSKPSVLDHLPVRPLLHDSKNTDIIQAILHGILDDEDFDELDKSGTINENTKKIYQLQKKAINIQQQLEKSQQIELEDDDNDDEEVFDEDSSSIENLTTSGKIQTGINVVKSYMDTAGVQYGLNVAREEFGEQGADLFAQILQAALLDVDEKTRMMVREEMDSVLAPVCDAIQALASHVGIDIEINDGDVDNSHIPVEENQLDDGNMLTNESNSSIIGNEDEDSP